MPCPHCACSLLMRSGTSEQKVAGRHELERAGALMQETGARIFEAFINVVNVELSNIPQISTKASYCAVSDADHSSKRSHLIRNQPRNSVYHHLLHVGPPLREFSLPRLGKHVIDPSNHSTALRNEFNHCMYVTDEAGQITHTQSMRIVESREHLQFGISKPLDDARLKKHDRSCQRSDKYQSRYLELLPLLQLHLQSKPE